jgi:hypothetical protein
LLISFSGRTKQIFFSVIKLEPPILTWLQPRKNNCVPTELDVSISATVVGLDSRGFLFGSTMALELGVPFVPIRNLVFDVSIFSYFDRFS